MKALCIIPARGGSKRIPRKNIKDFLGKPIISYAISVALESNLFDDVIVSTDDGEIVEIALKYGASVPFLRSKENSDDFASTIDVLFEVMNHPFIKVKNYTYACCIYPTSPLLTSDLLVNAFEHLKLNEFDSVLPVQRFSFPIQRAFAVKGHRLVWQFPENATKRSQDLPLSLHDSGQFYFFSIAPIIKKASLITDNSGGIEISEIKAQDIDNEIDWKMAELKYQLINEKI